MKIVFWCIIPLALVSLAGCGTLEKGPSDLSTTDPGTNLTDPGMNLTDSGPTTTFSCPAGTCPTTSTGPKMRPGQACTNCHGDDFAFAGTVYGPNGKPCGTLKQGVTGVKIEAIPQGGGQAVTIGTTNCVGNFHSYKGITGKVHFRVTYQDSGKTWTKTMSVNVNGSTGVGCATCHTAGGSAGAPVHL